MNNKRGGNEEQTNVGGNYDGEYDMCQDECADDGPTFIPVLLAT